MKRTTLITIAVVTVLLILGGLQVWEIVRLNAVTGSVGQLEAERAYCLRAHAAQYRHDTPDWQTYDTSYDYADTP